MTSPTPLQICEAFDSLLIRLAHVPQRPEYLLEIGLFIDEFLVASPPCVTRPILLELGDKLPFTDHEFAFTSIPPALFLKAAEAFSDISQHIENKDRKRLILGCSAVLKQDAVCTLAWIGDRKTCLAILSSGLTTELDERSHQVSPTVFLEEQTGVYRPDWLDRIAILSKKWERTVKPGGKDALFPGTILLSAPDGYQLAPHGRLRSLNLRFTEASASGDRIQLLAHQTAGPLDQVAISDPINAARRFLSASFPKAPGNGYMGAFYFSESYISHQGRSAFLTMAVLYVIEAVKFTAQRDQMRLKSGVVFSGDLDESGNVLEVDANTLPLKVQATFYSPASVLVFPLSQISIVRETLEILAYQFPNRILRTIGVEHLRDIFYRREIVEVKRRNLATHLAIKSWSKRNIVVPVFLVVLLALALVNQQLSQIDLHPNRVVRQDNSLILVNADNRTIDFIPLDAGTFREFNGTEPGYVLHDVNGDGFKDLIWLKSANYAKGEEGAITAWSGAERDTLWHEDTVYEFDYPNDMSVIHGRTRPVSMSLFELDGRLVVVVTVVQTDVYPSLALMYDAETGDLLQRYEHPGHIGNILVVDLNNDGLLELIVAGTNNSMGMGIVAVLSPRNLDGFAPASGGYLTSNQPTGNEIAYIRFPPGTKYLLKPPLQSSIQTMELREKDGLLRVAVDYNILAPDGKWTSVGVAYMLDFHLNPVSIITFDNFDRIWDLNRLAGRVHGPIDDEVKRYLLSLPEVLTDDGWVKLSEVDIDYQTD